MTAPAPNVALHRFQILFDKLAEAQIGEVDANIRVYLPQTEIAELRELDELRRIVVATASPYQPFYTGT